MDLTAGADAEIQNGSTIDKIYLAKDNSQNSPEQCPFSVGERVAIVTSDNASLLTTDKDLVISEINAKCLRN